MTTLVLQEFFVTPHPVGVAEVTPQSRPDRPDGKDVLQHPGHLRRIEVDLLRMRTREGMAVARAKGRLKGRKPKLSNKQRTELHHMDGTGDYTITDLPNCSTSRPTVYRTIAAVEAVPARPGHR